MAGTEWNKTYNPEDNSILRRLQLVELDLLNRFTRICEKYGLRYYLIGGTMLGAIRHKGFIPWDDDIDVAMPRPDYEIFLEIIDKELESGYGFNNYKTSKNYRRYFSRLVNTKVSVTNASNSSTIVEPAWLDIFPFDGMPSGAIKRRMHFFRMTFLRFFYHASCFDELVNLNRPGRSWYIRLAIKFIQITRIGTWLDTKKLLDKIDKRLQMYQYDESRYVVNFFGAYLQKEIIDKTWIGKGKKYQFENGMLYGPEKYDEYLSHFYGDYMIPPKDTDKDKHNIIEIDFGDSDHE